MDKMQKWTIVSGVFANEWFSQEIHSFGNNGIVYANPKEAWDAVGNLVGFFACYCGGVNIHAEKGSVEITVFNDKCTLKMVNA